MQVDRYKQLLLKQRDIMIALTGRLNERDEQILTLQEELEAYDAHQKSVLPLSHLSTGPPEYCLEPPAHSSTFTHMDVSTTLQAYDCDVMWSSHSMNVDVAAGPIWTVHN